MSDRSFSNLVGSDHSLDCEYREMYIQKRNIRYTIISERSLSIYLSVLHSLCQSATQGGNIVLFFWPKTQQYSYGE